MQSELFSSISNREIALFLWIAVFLGFALYKKDIRESLAEIVRILFGLKVLIPLLGLILSIALITWALYSVNFWEAQNTKDTLIWFVSVGSVLFVKLNKSDEPNYFRNLLREEVKVLSLLGLWTFLADFYVFGLFTEIVLVFVLLFLGALLGVTSTKEEYKQVKVFLEGILTFVGFIILLFVLYSLFTNIEALIQANSLREFFLPSIYTIFSIPYIFLLLVYAKYEAHFTFLENYSSGVSLAEKLMIIREFGIDFVALQNWQRFIIRTKAWSQKIDIDQSLKEFRRHPAVCNLD